LPETGVDDGVEREAQVQDIDLAGALLAVGSAAVVVVNVIGPVRAEDVTLDAANDAGGLPARLATANIHIDKAFAGAEIGDAIGRCAGRAAARDGRIRIVGGDDRLQSRGDVGIRDGNANTRSAVHVVGDPGVRADAQREWLNLGESVSLAVRELGVELLLVGELIIEEAGD